ncbi:MAG: hypothetical protein ACT6FC_06345, partial [Methanosarcinaceae archaeon]
HTLVYVILFISVLRLISTTPKIRCAYDQLFELLLIYDRMGSGKRNDFGAQKNSPFNTLSNSLFTYTGFHTIKSWKSITFPRF